MKINLTKEEEQLLTLFEKGFYHELLGDEQRFILKFMTEEAFNLQHELRLESKKWRSPVAPKPLQLPKENNQTIRLIWISISSAAAAAVLTFFIVKEQFNTILSTQMPVYLTDTVYVPKIDTIIKYEKGKTVCVHESAVNHPEINKHDSFISNEELPPIKLYDGKHRAVSMHEERKEWQLNSSDVSDVFNLQK